MLLTHRCLFIHVQQTIMAKNALLLMFLLKTLKWTLLRPRKKRSCRKLRTHVHLPLLKYATLLCELGHVCRFAEQHQADCGPGDSGVVAQCDEPCQAVISESAALHIHTTPVTQQQHSDMDCTASPMWLPRTCSATSGGADGFEDDGAGVSTPVATLVSMHPADLAPCLSLDKMQRESLQPCIDAEACGDQQDQQQQQQLCQAQLPGLGQAGNGVLQPRNSFHDGHCEQAGATGPGQCAASSGAQAADAMAGFSFPLASQPQASPNCGGPALTAAAPGCGGASTGTAAADQVMHVPGEGSRVQHTLTSAAYGCGGSGTDSAAPDLATAAVNICSQAEGSQAADLQVTTSSENPMGVTEDPAHASSAADNHCADNHCQAAQDSNTTTGELLVAAGGAGSAAGVAAGAAGAVGDAEVAELRLRLASVEASRDELARQQGQYKGLIARVSVCLLVAGAASPCLVALGTLVCWWVSWCCCIAGA